jgi:hypothetical protein
VCSNELIERALRFREKSSSRFEIRLLLQYGHARTGMEAHVARVGPIQAR